MMALHERATNFPDYSNDQTACDAGVDAAKRIILVLHSDIRLNLPE